MLRISNNLELGKGSKPRKPINLGLRSGFKKSAKSGTTRPSRIRLNADCNESDTRDNLYLDLTLNRLDSDDLIDIPS